MKESLKSFRKILEHCLSLLIVFLLLSSVAVWSGKFFGRDILGSATEVETTIKQSLAPTTEVITELDLNPSEVNVTQRDSATWKVTENSDKKLIGHIVYTGLYAQEVTGYAGPTPLYILVSPQHTIVQITPGKHTETPSFFNRAYKGIIPEWIGKDLEAGKDLEVDAVSGATYTSLALIQNVKNTLDVYSAHHTTWIKGPAIGWVRTIAVLAVLLLSLFATKLNRRFHFFRPVMLLLNVLVLGFWCGQFLSLSLLRGWVTNGLDPLLNLPVLCMLLVAVFTSFFAHKHHYCTWVCPLGSLQTLASLLPLPKIKVGAKIARFMNRLRFYVFCVLMGILWLGIGGFILDYEPFTAFMLDAALPGVIVLTCIIVVSSCFIPNLWCRALCPMGSLLDLSEK